MLDRMDTYDWAIEELALSGTVGLGPCHPSTVYRWARTINKRLEAGKYDWRVKPDVKNRAVIVDPDVHIRHIKN